MAFQINLYQERRQENVNYGKIYGRAANKKPIGIEQLAEHIAMHGSPYDYPTIVGVLAASAKCIRELILQNQPIKLPNLCIFYGTVTSTAANTVQDFDLFKNIKNLRLHCRATGKLASGNITRGGEGGVELEYTDLAEKIRNGRVNIQDLYESDGEGGGSGGGGGDQDPDPVRP